MRRILQDTLKIFIITAVAGLLLGGVYVITKEPIAKAQEAAQQAAYKEVFAEAESFEAFEYDAAQVATILSEAGCVNETIDGVVVAKDASGNAIGYVFTVTTSAGYGGDITFSVGMKNDGTVNGYSILSISETAGLGMKAKEDAFKNQFNDKKVDRFVVTKTGATTENQIDAISGATITSDAVTGGVNACIAYMKTLMTTEGGAANE